MWSFHSMGSTHLPFENPHSGVDYVMKPDTSLHEFVERAKFIGSEQIHLRSLLTLHRHGKAAPSPIKDHDTTFVPKNDVVISWGTRFE